jgi:hypothetical protein
MRCPERTGLGPRRSSRFPKKTGSELARRRKTGQVLVRTLTRPGQRARLESVPITAALPPYVRRSEIVGGLLFGVGFLVGGYCPGTAVVGAATLKLDGLLFVLGVAEGILAFGYTEPGIEPFWNGASAYGRVTLFDWFGLSMPMTVLLVVTIALGFFAAAEWVEHWMKGRAREPRSAEVPAGAAEPAPVSSPASTPRVHATPPSPGAAGRRGSLGCCSAGSAALETDGAASHDEPSGTLGAGHPRASR